MPISKLTSLLFASIGICSCDPETDEAILAAEIVEEAKLADEDEEVDEDEGPAGPRSEHTLAVPQGEGLPATFWPLPVNGTGQTNSVPQGGAAYYKFTMKKGVSYTVRMNYNPWMGNDYTRDPDLYTHNSSSISTSNYLCRPFLGPGKSEKCSFVAPWDGTNYAMVYGFTNAAFYIYVTSP